MKRRLFAPAVALMDRLTYPRKFLLISVLFGIPLALATYFLFGEINDSLEIARRQVIGLRYLEASQPLFRRIQEHMEEEISPLRGETGEARRQRQLAEVTEAFAVLARVQRELGPILNSAQRFGTVKSNVETLTYELSRPGTERAIRMAVAMRDRVKELAVRWEKLGYELDVGVGIAQGYATIGAIGFEGRWDYGAIGTVTNLAARLCGEAKGGQILVSRRVASSAEALVDAEPVGALTLKGFARHVPASLVTGLKPAS